MKARIASKIRCLAIAIASICAATISAHADTIMVTKTNDSGPGSLRQALADTNDGDTITFAVTGIIGLTSGELLVDRSITISGPGADSLAVDGNLQSRVFQIGAGRTVTISGLTIKGGFANSGGGIYNDHAALIVINCEFGANHAIANGAGIYNDGEQDGGATLQISNCTFRANASEGFGGGISNDGSLGGDATLEIDASIFDTNQGDSGGGAVANVGDSGTATLEIHMSVLSDNFALDGTATHNRSATSTLDTCMFSVSEEDGRGAGIYNRNATSILDTCTLSVNEAASRGAGIYNKGSEKGAAMLTVNNSALLGNFAVKDGGGGIYNEGSPLGSANVQITNSTLNLNSAPSGSAMYNNGQSGAATLEIHNSTFSDNFEAFDAGIHNLGGKAMISLANTILKAGGRTANIINESGTVTSHGYNLSSDDGGGYLTFPGDQINTDPLLGPLRDNGGPTFTHELLNGSPAIDAGDPGFTPPPFYDQRGPDFFRVRNGRVDIGSFEAQVGSTPTPPPSPTPTPTPIATPSLTSTPTPTSTPTAMPGVTPRPRPTPHPRPEAIDDSTNFTATFRVVSEPFLPDSLLTITWGEQL